MLLSQAGGPLPTGGDVRNFVLTSCQHLYHSTVLTSCQYRKRKNSCRVGRWGGSGPAQVRTCEVVSRPTPGGSPAFSGESRRKERRGRRPRGPRVLWPLVATRWVWGSSSLIRSKGYFVRYTKTDLGRIFREKYAGKHFCERKFPNQGTYMGPEIGARPEQCGTQRQNERVGTSGS